MSMNKDQLTDMVSSSDLSSMQQFARIMAFSIILFAYLLPSTANAATYKLMTGNRTGPYYPAAIAMRTLLDLKQSEENSVHFRVVGSSGAVENMHALLKGEVDVAFADASTIVAVLTKQPPFDKYEDNTRLKALAPLWSDVGHFVLRKADTNTNGIEDFGNLLGATVSFGPKQSTNFLSAAHVFARNGIYFDRLFTLPDLDPKRTVKAFHSTLIDGFALFISEGDQIMEMALEDTKTEGRLLNINDLGFHRLNNSEIPIWRRHVIAANTYPNQQEAINTIAQSNFLVVRSDFDNKDALHIAKTLVENVSFLEALHPAMSQIDDYDVDSHAYLPLHPGVEKYYRETLGCRSILCLFN